MCSPVCPHTRLWTHPVCYTVPQFQPIRNWVGHFWLVMFLSSVPSLDNWSLGKQGAVTLTGEGPLSALLTGAPSCIKYRQTSRRYFIKVTINCISLMACPVRTWCWCSTSCSILDKRRMSQSRPSGKMRQWSKWCNKLNGPFSGAET